MTDNLAKYAIFICLEIIHVRHFHLSGNCQRYTIFICLEIVHVHYLYLSGNCHCMLSLSVWKLSRYVIFICLEVTCLSDQCRKYLFKSIIRVVVYVSHTRAGSTSARLIGVQEVLVHISSYECREYLCMSHMSAAST